MQHYVKKVVEITQTNNNEGEPIFGYFSLKSDSEPDFQIRLRESKEEAGKETKIGLERLLKKVCRETMTIPKEEPWYVTNWRNYLSDLGEALQARFETLVKEHAENLTTTNVVEKITALKAAAEAAKTEIATEYTTTKELLEKAKEIIDRTISSVECHYVETEIKQVSELYKEAKDLFEKASYVNVHELCQKALNIANQLPELINLRSAKKQEAEACYEQIKEDVCNWQHGSNEKLPLASTVEKTEIREIIDEIKKSFSEYRFDTISEKVENLKNLFARLEIRLNKFQQFIRQEYSFCPVCGEKLDYGDHYCKAAGQQKLQNRIEYGESLKLKASTLDKDETVEIAYFLASYTNKGDRVRITTTIHWNNLGWSEKVHPGYEIITTNFWNKVASKATETEKTVLKSEINSVLAKKQGGVYGPFETTGKFTKKGYPIWSYIDQNGITFSVDSWSNLSPAKDIKYLGWINSELKNHKGDTVKFVRLELEFTDELQEIMNQKSPQAQEEIEQPNSDSNESENSDYSFATDLAKLKTAWGK